MKMTRYRWVVCALLFFATTINYVDRQVFGILGPRLTEEFHWTESHFSLIVSAFTLAYAISYTVAGRMMDWLGERKGFALAVAVWSLAAMATRPGESPGLFRAAVAQRRAGRDLVGQLDADDGVGGRIQRGPLRPGLGRRGQLPGRDQDRRHVASHERTGHGDRHFQCRQQHGHYRRRLLRAVRRRADALGLARGILSDRDAGLRLAGVLVGDVRTARAASACRWRN